VSSVASTHDRTVGGVDDHVTWWSIYDGEGEGMAAAVGAWLLETMNDCAYAEHVADELKDLEKRLVQGRASGTDVYLLRNVAVLIDCALRDFGVYITECF
jgi:hypothetical protein